MTAVTRESELFSVIATLADTLVDDYDLVELLQTLVDNCVAIFDVSAAGILLLDSDDELDVVASTSEESRLVEVMQLSADDGPCIEAFRTASMIEVPDLRDATARWPDFRAAALELGFTAVTAVPMRLRASTIGTLNMLATTAGSLSAPDLRAAQALADMATIGILHERTLRAEQMVREQLERALSSRMVIERAKGILSYANGLDMDAAFALLRGHARAHRLPLSEVAARVVDRSLEL